MVPDWLRSLPLNRYQNSNVETCQEHVALQDGSGTEDGTRDMEDEEVVYDDENQDNKDFGIIVHWCSRAGPPMSCCLSMVSGMTSEQVRD